MPPELSPQVLNELYKIYERSDMAGREKILIAEIEKRGLSQHQRLIQETFAIVLGAPYVFLDKYPGGAVSSEKLWTEHETEIRRASPWLDEENFQRACAQSQYYAWHDGLVKSN